VSISPIFYEQLFDMKVFMWIQFGFVIYWQKDFSAKADHKMLVKLIPGVPEAALVEQILLANI